MDEETWTDPGDVADSSGNDRAGDPVGDAATAQSDPALGGSGTGTCGYGVFDGDGDYVEDPDAANYLSGKSALTVTAWVKNTDAIGNDRGIFTTASPSNQDNRLGLRYDQEGATTGHSQTLKASLNTTQCSDGSDCVQVEAEPGLQKSGEWQHIAMTWQSGGKIRLYVDGSEVSTTVTSNGTPGGTLDAIDFLRIGQGKKAGDPSSFWQGNIDEFRVYDQALDASQIQQIYQATHTCPIYGLVCNTHGFESSLGADWETGNENLGGTTFGDPQVVTRDGESVLRLTNQENNLATRASLLDAIPWAGNRVRVTFKYYSYGTDDGDADGIAVTFSDASKTLDPGGYGGSLGYAQRCGVAGFNGGWLGIGIDEFGNYSNDNECRQGGTGFVPDAVAVRGDGDGTDSTDDQNYEYLAGSGSLTPPLSDPTTDTPARGHVYRIIVDTRTNNGVPEDWLVRVLRDTDGLNTGSGFTEILRTDVKGEQETAPPSNVYLTFTGSTGGETNFHEIDDLEICATKGIGPDLDHYQVTHDGTAVSCAAEPITLEAHDSSHAAVDPGNATIDLSTNTGEGTWAQVRTGSGTLSDPTAGDGAASYTFPDNGETSVTLDFNYTTVTAGTPETVNFNVRDGLGNTEDGTEDPDLTVSHSGFRITDGSGNPVNIPNQIAGKPSDTAPNAQTLGLQAIRTSDSDPSQCVPAFPDGTTVEVELAAECKDPATCAGNELSVTNDSTTTAIDTSDDNAGGGAASYEPVDLLFGANAEADLVLSYPDAGALQLHARANPIDDGSGSPPVVQYITGSSNTFPVRPFGFYLDFDPGGDGTFDDRNANGTCGTQVSCAGDDNGDVFAVAGADFSARIQAVVWESGDDGDSDGVPDSNQAIKDNAATPNFGNEASPETVNLSRTLVSPSSGSAGTLSGGSAVGGFSAGAVNATGLAWSEVGIIHLDANLSDNAYLSAGDVTGRAPNLGRFVPDRLVLADNDPDFRDATDTWGSPFTYMGQAFTYATGSEPAITFEALNAAGATTQNYGGFGTGEDFWKLADPARAYTDATSGIAASFTADQGPGTVSWEVAGSDTRADYDGQATLTISGDEFRYDRTATLQAPFDARVDLTFAEAELTDSDGVCHDSNDDGTCEDYVVDADNGSSGQQAITGTELRYGRLVVGNAHGPETEDLELPVRAEYWDGARFAVNGADGSSGLTVDGEAGYTPVDLQGDGGGWQNASGSVALIDGSGSGSTSGQQGFLSGGAGPASPSSLTGGTARLVLDAPGAGNTGYVAVRDQVVADFPWLAFDWDNADNDDNPVTGLDNPVGRATFGRYTGNEHILYWQEVFQ